ncbi:MAG TPA: YndJ family protein [Pyrinomonadaceae bacterium]|nr:YndJ family protein [Pyrinomonadaceae bacterium]
MSSAARFARLSAVAGVVVWLLLLPAATSDSRETELIHKVVFFAIFVIVPLCLSLIATDEERGSGLYRLVVFAQPIAAVVTALSFFFPNGTVAALLSSAWFVLNALIGLMGVLRLWSRRVYPLHELSVDAGLLYLPVAGAWLVVYRYGIQPFDYGETIILLTVVHFHFAGFAAPIIAGLSGRVLATVPHPSRLFGVVVFALIAAMPLVAAGITFSPWLGFIGALLITAGLFLLAVLTVRWVIPAVNPLARRLLLFIGALSSCSAMVLACLYAYSLATKTLIIDIPTMAMTHGLLNAFGFVTCSLLAWTTFSLKAEAR